MQPTGPSSAPLSSVRALVLAAAAYGIWGLFPLYFKTVTHIPPLEVLAQRTVWAFVFTASFMVVMGRREIFSRAFYAPRTLAIMAASGLSLAVNWGLFIVAVANDQVLASSLGYFTAPFVSVLLGVGVLGERPRPLAWAAIAVAALGVANLMTGAGELPWIALGLAVSWGLYGLMRKLSPLGSLAGLYTETLLLSPFALAYLVWLGASGSLVFATGTVDTLLLVGVGALTTLPLLLFARAARLLPLTTIGVLQYIVPTGQFALAVFVFDEPFGRVQLVTFALIWLALALYVGDLLRHLHRTSGASKTT